MSVNSYKIVANGVELDTIGDAEVNLNFQIEDITDLLKRNTSYSKSFDLAGSASNNKFFKQIFDVNIDNESFNPSKKIDGYIRVGDNQIFNGYIRLMDITILNGEVRYTINFTDNLKDIIKEIEDYSIRDLDLSRFNHTRNPDNVADSWEYKVVENGTLKDKYGPGDGYVYPYIINGDSTKVWDTAYLYDWFAAPYVKTLIDELFKFAGFTYTSKFFESDYFKKLIMPNTSESIEMSDDEEKVRTTKVGVPGGANTYLQITPSLKIGSYWWHNTTNGYNIGYPNAGLTRESGVVSDGGSDLEFTDDSGQWDGAIFTADKTGRYDIRFDGKLILKVIHTSNKSDMEFKSGNFEYRYFMEVVRTNGDVMTIDSSVDPNDPNDVYGTRLFSPSAGQHASPWYDIQNPLVMSMSADDLMLEAGDVIRVGYGFRYPGSIKWKGVSDKKHRASLHFKQSYDGIFTKFTAVPSSKDSYGYETVDITNSLPEKLKMKDFFMDIVRMFNLIILDNPNKNGDLIVEPREEFFESKQERKDWNGKLDNDSEVKLTPMSKLDSKAYLYSYEQDDDMFNEMYSDEYNKTYGEKLINVVNDFSDKTNDIDLKFASTPNASKYINNRSAPYFVEMQDDWFKSKKVKPRILFYDGLKGNTTLKLKDNPKDNNYKTYSQYPYTGMWDDPLNPSYTLEFGPSKKHYWDTNKIPKNTIFEKFHKKTLNNITDLNATLLEASFYLTPSDIASFDFRDIIFLKGAYWRVNKIKDFKAGVSDSLTKVQLYKIIDIDIKEPFTVNAPASNTGCKFPVVSKKIVGKNGKIRYVIEGSNGQAISKGCCESFGGSFAEGICYDYPTVPNEPGYEKAPGGIEVTKPKPKLPIDGPGISEPNPPIGVDSNTAGRLGVKFYGENNYIKGEAAGRLIIGDNSSIQKNVKNSIVIGDGITAKESGAIYLGDIKITQDGNILKTGSIIDGGKDEVFNFNKTSPIDVVDGGIDSVRNPGGDSKARPIIDGGEI